MPTRTLKPSSVAAKAPGPGALGSSFRSSGCTLGHTLRLGDTTTACKVITSVLSSGPDRVRRHLSAHEEGGGAPVTIQNRVVLDRERASRAMAATADRMTASDAVFAATGQTRSGSSTTAGGNSASSAQANDAAASLSDNYHSFNVSGSEFVIERKYTLIRPVGQGAYGVVISADDHSANRKVAIKKIPRAFDDEIDAKRILREMKLLRDFHHENIIGIIDIMPPADLNKFDDIYIVQELMETDLHRIIYSKQQLSIDHVQYFMYQILRALKYMHSAHVVHRDLKPSNILLNSNCDLKVCDFGLARGVLEDCGDLTEYVVTRWYRAPEIMLSCQEYTKAIDVWSVGCIFAEVLNREPLFPGNDYLHQIRLICQRLGVPREEDLGFVTNDRAKAFLLGCESSNPPFASLFPSGTDPHAIQLVQRMLKLNPVKRITVEEALEHPFMSTLHSKDDEPEADFIFSWDFEHGGDIALDDVRQMIWDEMRTFHPDITARAPELQRSSAPAASIFDGKQQEAVGAKESHGDGKGTEPTRRADTEVEVEGCGASDGKDGKDDDNEDDDDEYEDDYDDDDDDDDVEEEDDDDENDMRHRRPAAESKETKRHCAS